MKICDSATAFVVHYEPTIAYLENYFAHNQEQFTEYFTYHCLRKEQKMQDALGKHPAQLKQI